MFLNFLVHYPLIPVFCLIPVFNHESFLSCMIKSFLSAREDMTRRMPLIGNGIHFCQIRCESNIHTLSVFFDNFSSKGLKNTGTGYIL